MNKWDSTSFYILLGILAVIIVLVIWVGGNP